MCLEVEHKPTSSSEISLDEILLDGDNSKELDDFLKD